jgi:putative ABC transport system ATP-binding protein
MTLISLRGVSKSFTVGADIVHALNDISLSIERNTYVAFIGSSGSGKSTLMNVLGCLDQPSAGSYHLNGSSIADMNERQLADVRNREVGFIFQSFNLLPRLDALQNVMQPLVYRTMSTKERRERALQALIRVGLESRVEHLPSQMSGGQRQRVAIARALVTQPSMLLADEPTGNLDSRTASEILTIFSELHANGATIVVVTHDAEVAKRSDRVITLSDGMIQSDEHLVA